MSVKGYLDEANCDFSYLFIKNDHIPQIFLVPFPYLIVLTTL